MVEIEKYHSEVVAIHLFEHILPQFESPRFRIQLQIHFLVCFFNPEIDEEKKIFLFPHRFQGKKETLPILVPYLIFLHVS